MNSQNPLFGQLPEYPPWDANESYCSECSACYEQLAKTNTDNVRQGTKQLNKQLFPKRNKQLKKASTSSKLCRISSATLTVADINAEVMEAIEDARKKAGLCQSKHTYINFKDSESEQMLARRKREYEFRLKEAATQGQKSLQRKSEKQYFQNLKKKCTSLNHKSQNLHRMHKLQQDNAYQLLHEERAQYLKKLHTLMFELEKGRVLEEKRNFKENLTQNASRAKQELQAIESKHRNTVEELRQTLDEVRKEKHTNRIDQKKVIRELEQHLKEQQKLTVQKTQARIANEVERAQLDGLGRYGQKQQQLRR